MFGQQRAVLSVDPSIPPDDVLRQKVKKEPVGLLCFFRQMATEVVVARGHLC
jgi:hypothetical protein